MCTDVSASGSIGLDYLDFGRSVIGWYLDVKFFSTNLIYLCKGLKPPTVSSLIYIWGQLFLNSYCFTGDDKCFFSGR